MKMHSKFIGAEKHCCAYNLYDVDACSICADTVVKEGRYILHAVV